MNTNEYMAMIDSAVINHLWPVKPEAKDCTIATGKCEGCEAIGEVLQANE
ncbi:MAG: hypothetical protein M3362_00205 [Acidobacteriota bacterium]|nr:hypothetical protein [Acidobacteriota bacterium]